MNNIFFTKITELLETKGISTYKLGQICGYSHGAIIQMIKGSRSIPEHILNKISVTLEVPDYKLKGWILADKYSRDVLERALHLKQEYAGQDKLIFTAKIHELMEQHNLTINPFAKAIGYNQGWLSQVVLGKEPVSKKLMDKLCAFSSLSEEEIISWIVADKYSVEALRTAVGC